MSQSEQKIVVDALVQWTGGKGYGVVTSIDDKIIRVRWDDDGNPSRFAATDPPLDSRVDLRGQAVQRHSTGQEVSVLISVETTTPTWRCRVFTQGAAPANVNVPEADLRPIPITDPISRFKANLIGSLKQYRLQEVTRRYRALHLNNDLVSIGNVGVDIKPHQVGVVHRVISNYPHRFLLCDEVGLGKTIEAGMALKELRIRGGAQRVLIMVPPNLVRQWQFEMKTKFNESFAVLNTDTVRHLKNQGHTGNPFASYSDSVLCSSSWIAQPIWAKMCAEVDWDLVIVDEAHHARSRRSGSKIETTRLYRLVRKLSTPEHSARRGMLFLTATPMQLDTHELYSLVELIDPSLFPSEEDFEKHCSSVPGLNQLVERLKSQEFSPSDDDSEEVVGQVAEWLEVDVDAAQRRLSAGEEELETLADELSDHHLLSEVLIRNRKAVVGGFMPRIANRWEVELTPEEHDALQAVETYVQYGFNLAEGANDNALGFVMVIFQRLMASSIAAIRKSLSDRREKIRSGLTTQQSEAELEERLDNDDNAGNVVGTPRSVAGMAGQELRILGQTIEVLDRVQVDSKARALINKLAELFREYPNEKVLIFTQFHETQRHLRELLARQGWSVNLFHGQMKAVEKDRAVERFRNDTGSQVLISTEAGGEGRNFQFCHLLVNYDLPWNPMKVEQRIGRVDRIGQENAVRIFNLWVKGTIEERVLDVLENRIKVFEETVGGLDPILGETEDDIRRIMRTADRERDAAIEEFGKRMEQQVRQARQAGTKLGDFIMDTKSYRREIAERITGQPSPIDNEDIDRFIGQLLADVRTYIKSVGDKYELTFRQDFVDTHKAHFASGLKRKAVFRPDRRTDSEDTEFMAFGHPIVDAIVKQVLSEEYKGVTGTRRIPATDNLAPTSGWLFTYQFTIPGPQSTEHLVPIFVSDKGEVDINTGHRLVQTACRFDAKEQEIEPSEVPDNLCKIEALANLSANNKRETFQQKAESQAAEQINREVERLKKWFDYRENAARKRLETTKATLSRLRASEDESQRQILPVWEANLRHAEGLLSSLTEERRRRIAEAERHRYPQVDWALKSLGRIEVVAPN